MPRTRTGEFAPAASSIQAMHPATVVLLRGNEEVTRWTLYGDANLQTVDELARLQLSAKRLGCRIALEDPCPGLVKLLDLVGLGVEMER